MTTFAENLETNLADSYSIDIQRAVAEAHITEGLEKLVDFARDFAPNLINHSLGLYSRYSYRQQQVRQGIPPSERLQVIIAAILELTEEIRASGAKKNIQGTSSDGLQDSIVARAAFVNGEYRPTDRSAVRGLDQVRAQYLQVWRKMAGSEALSTIAEAKDVTLSFGDKDAFCLGPLSFKIVAGEITGIVGINASGKTTLLRLLLGDIAPQAGTLHFPALSARPDNWKLIKRQIAYVPQLPTSCEGRLRRHLDHVAAAFGTVSRQDENLVDRYIVRYGLKEYEDATWNEISGGFKIRFELVRALLSAPRLLILDEPLAYLDISTQQTFLSDIRAIASSLERPISIILTSQHVLEVENIADRMIILDSGQCIYAGLPVDLLDHSADWVWEIGISSDKMDILGLLQPHGLADIQATHNGYIVAMPKNIDRDRVLSELFSSLGSKISYFRDITKSTRRFFVNRPEIR